MDKIALLSLKLAPFFSKELAYWVLNNCLLNFISFYCLEAALLAVLFPEASGAPPRGPGFH